jgi:hypothetical protein
MEVGSVTFEIELPDEWPPGLGFAVAKMIRESLTAGFPVVIPVRSDITRTSSRQRSAQSKRSSRRRG